MTKLLIADDDEDVRFVLERIFSRADFTVYVAANGTAALQVATVVHPDVVLTDLDMPGMSGLDLCQAVRADPQLRDVPVAILSGSIQLGDRRPAQVDACRMLLKPIGNKELVAAVRALADEGRHEHGDTSPCRARAYA